MGEFVVAPRQRSRGLVHRAVQIARRQIGDEFAALLGERAESFQPSLEKPTIGGALEKPLKKL